MVFHWCLSDSKSPQVSRTLLSILNNAVVWMVTTRPLTSKSSSLFNNPFVVYVCHFLGQMLGCDYYYYYCCCCGKHTHTHTHTNIYMYIYIKRERERERVCVCVYIYICVCVCVRVHEQKENK